MQTFKTAVVVVLLLLLLYGVYVVLSVPEAQRAAADLARTMTASAGSPPNGQEPADGQSWHDPLADAPPVSLGYGADSSMADDSYAGAMAPPAHGGHHHDSHHPGREGGERDGAASTPRSNVALASGTSADLEGAAPPPLETVEGDPHAAHRASRRSSSGSFDTGASDEGPSDLDDAPPRPLDPRRSTDGQAGAGLDADGEMSPPGAGNHEPAGTRAFEKAMREARDHIGAERYRDALHALSIFYNSPDLEPAQHSQLLDLLDPLAGEVIYSARHLLEDPYEVRRNETLYEIARRYQVPWQLLRNINGVRDPEVLVPGTQLKVVPGPFRAEVDVRRGELTLFLGRLYAGRFPVTFGNDPAPQPGGYEVRDKRTDRSYYGSDGRTIAPEDPANPYGGFWLDLGGEMSIHGSPQTDAVPTRRLGCVSLSPRDARDVFGILSVGSKVVLRR